MPNFVTEEKFYSLEAGTAISCRIESTDIDDAKIQIQDDRYFICQNKKDGNGPRDRLGYSYGWSVGKGPGGLQKNSVTQITLLSKKKLPTMELKLEHFDKVIISEDSKKQIIAVLRQHNNYAKIFDEWGLGDVIEYGKGMTFLFHGPPGTGKTWAANCIAKAVGRELLVIGASEIQTSEPGGANRNIQNAFKAAKSKKVLFFDECDSLITMRNQVGMIIGSEINTLLTEIEKFEGICILATNRIETLDEALERRISLIIEFPAPSYTQRQDIWTRMLPVKMPRAKDVKIDELAEYKLTGGQIKNVVLNAARAAVSEEKDKVYKRHFVESIERLQGSSAIMGTADRHVHVKVDHSKSDSHTLEKVADKVPALV